LFNFQNEKSRYVYMCEKTRIEQTSAIIFAFGAKRL